jgi:hypothetical protein
MDFNVLERSVVKTEMSRVVTNSARIFLAAKDSRKEFQNTINNIVT